MNCAFLPPASALPLRRTRLPACKRRPQRLAQNTPKSLAKYQQQDKSETPDSETPLESIIPPPVLPTLTTLTGQKAEKELPLEETKTEIDLSDLVNQGSGISAEQENQITTFVKGVGEEFGRIEWPSAERVIRLTAIIIVTLFVAVVSLYFVDGFFYRMANIFFEGKI